MTYKNIQDINMIKENNKLKMEGLKKKIKTKRHHLPYLYANRNQDLRAVEYLLLRMLSR